MANKDYVSGMKASDIIMEALHDAEMTPARQYYKECFAYVRNHAEQEVVGEGHATRRWYNKDSVRKTAMDFIAQKKGKGRKVMGGKEFFSVIIAGGRTFSDYTLLEKKCDAFFANKQPTSIVCGGAKGADMLGKRYADEHHIAVEMYPADWGKNGKRAGYIRNWEMLQAADALVAFWDGESKGTKHMIEIAKEAGIPVCVVRY